MDFISATTPRLSARELLKKLATHKIDFDKHKLIIVGIRGYYKNTLGEVGKNDRGIYDDAIFVYSPVGMVAYNGNTDPTGFRKGDGAGSTKGMAVLKTGAYYAHKLGLHKGKYLALVQRLGKVTVIRDGINGDYEDTGEGFGINIHKGEMDSTSSEGCQTIPPTQWNGFINLVKELAKRYYGNKWEDTVIPYILLEN